MFAKVISGTPFGVEARLVEVQCDVGPGLPGFSIVGLPEKEVSEARERVRSAIRNLGLPFPGTRITANLAPADLKKEGAGLDLALAVALLVATGEIPEERVAGLVFYGELSLDGELRPVKGALAVALAAREEGLPAWWSPTLAPRRPPWWMACLYIRYAAWGRPLRFSKGKLTSPRPPRRSQKNRPLLGLTCAWCGGRSMPAGRWRSPLPGDTTCSW